MLPNIPATCAIGLSNVRIIHLRFTSKVRQMRSGFFFLIKKAQSNVLTLTFSWSIPVYGDMEEFKKKSNLCLVLFYFQFNFKGPLQLKLKQKLKAPQKNAKHHYMKLFGCCFK